MNRDDIIKMANKAGLFHFYDSEGQCTGITNARLVTQDKDRWDDRLVEMLAPFAALVRADEREQCAVYLERGVDLSGLDGHPGWQNYTADLLAGCAAAIREREKQNDL